MSSEPGSEGEEHWLQSSGPTGATRAFAGTRTGSLWLSRTPWRRERATSLEGSGDVVEGQRIWHHQQQLKVELRRIEGRAERASIHVQREISDLLKEQEEVQ